MTTSFDYDEAFCRNIGILSAAEQARLRRSHVAIAGLGAVGGNYLLALARMGVGGFSIADPDSFEPANLHRQAGAFAHTLGRPKAEVMARMAEDINPEVDIRVFPEGLTETNAGEFLRGADLVLDGIDFFQIDARRVLYRAARERGLYVVIAAPLGYGSTLHVFDPAGMSFDEYFGIAAGMSRAERLAAFGAGLLPKLPSGRSMDASRVDFQAEKGPALAPAVMLCCGLASIEALRILLGRGAPRCVPHSSYFDPYRGEYVRALAPKGRGGWRARLVRWLAFRKYPSLRRLHRAERSAKAAGGGTPEVPAGVPQIGRPVSG